MIYIRYSADLRPGLNASAECGRRGTTIYMLPGLTPAQRRAALRRLRQQGRMGLGPRLPGRRLAVALALFRIRNMAARASAVFRVHPAGSAVPLLLLSACVSVFVLTSVSVRIVPPQAAGGGPAGLGAPPRPVPSGQLGNPAPLQAQPVAAGVPAQPGTGAAGQSGGVAGQHSPALPSWPGAPPGATTSGSPPGGTTPPGPATGSSPATGTSPPSGTSSAPASGPPGPGSSPSASPVPSPTGNGGAVCVTLGPIQVCV